MKTMIVQIAGNNGVGKTYWLKRILINTEVIEEISPKPGLKPIAFIGRNNGKIIGILGRRTSGGDAIQSIGMLVDLIGRLNGKVDTIVFEGLMASHNWKLLIPFYQSGSETYCIFLDEPPEVSAKNVEARRKKPLTEKQKQRIHQRYKALISVHKKRIRVIPCIKANRFTMGPILEDLGLCVR